MKAFEIEFIPDFTATVAPKMIQAGAAVLEPVVKRTLQQTVGNQRYLVGKSKSTGSLVESIRVSNTFIRDAGTRFFANVYFIGIDATGKRQGEKAAYLNYGTGKGGIRVRSVNGKRVSTGNTAQTKFATRASSSAQRNVRAAMLAVLEKELRGEFNNG